MELFTSQALGTVFYSIVMLVAGALVVGPAWSWLNAKLPWNK